MGTDELYFLRSLQTVVDCGVQRGRRETDEIDVRSRSKKGTPREEQDEY